MSKNVEHSSEKTHWNLMESDDDDNNYYNNQLLLIAVDILNWKKEALCRLQ